VRGQVNYILIPFLVMLAALILITAGPAVERWQMEMEGKHLALIRARGFGYNGSLLQLLNSLCEGGSFTTYVERINITADGSASFLCGEGCERIACRAEPFHCHHCVVEIAGSNGSLSLRRVDMG